MTQKTHKYWFNTGGNAGAYRPGGVTTPEDYEFLKDNDWNIIVTIPYYALGGYGSYSTNGAAVSTWMADQFVDYGIPILFGIEMPLAYNAPWTNTTPSPPCPPIANNTIWYDTTEEWYETNYGDQIDAWESYYGDDLVGYQWENGWKTGVDWLRARTTKRLVQSSYYTNYGWDLGAGFVPFNTLTPAEWAARDPNVHGDWVTPFGYDQIIDRAQHVDEFVHMIWTVYSYYSLVGMLTYLRAHQASFPDCTFGVQTGWYEPALQTAAGYWNDVSLGAPAVSYDEELSRVKYYLNAALDAIGIASFDSIVLQVAPALVSWSEYAEKIGAQITPTKSKQCAHQEGITPFYAGASTCIRDTTKPPDTLVNTGNELILLKDVGTVSTHDITVTSTDTLTHEDYTIALNPDRGTFIGPYPLDDYGALPTITYDTTNLYVSILKDVPYA